MSFTYDLFWSFRSPYSYLITKRLVALEKEYDVTAKVRPVYPIVMRIDDFFNSRDPLWIRYLMLDVPRNAEMQGLPCSWPSPDPVQMDPATGNVPKEQPYIHRLTRLGVAAAEAGRGLAFLDEASSLLWGGTVDWHEGDHLAKAAERAGLDLAELDARIEADPDRYESEIVANEAVQSEAHWGVPLMLYNGEPYFGQDRFDLMKWRMLKDGLAKRA